MPSPQPTRRQVRSLAGAAAAVSAAQGVQPRNTDVTQVQKAMNLA